MKQLQQYKNIIAEKDDKINKLETELSEKSNQVINKKVWKNKPHVNFY